MQSHCRQQAATAFTFISNLSSLSTTSMGMGRSPGDAASEASRDRNGLNPAQEAQQISLFCYSALVGYKRLPLVLLQAQFLPGKMSSSARRVESAMSSCFVFRLTRRATMALRQRRTVCAQNGEKCCCLRRSAKGCRPENVGNDYAPRSLSCTIYIFTHNFTCIFA